MGKTMKKFLCTLLVVVMCLTSAPLQGFVGLEWLDINFGEWFGSKASAAEYTEGYYTYTLADGKATITDVDISISGDVVIPSKLGGCIVTAIDDSAFGYCENLIRITVPDSITTIGDYAFDRCYSLTSITIPDSVTIIGVGAFYCCHSLTSVTIPDFVTAIGDCTFTSCYSLSSITIPDSVTIIGYDAFIGCDDLTNITIPNSVTTIGASAFSSCDGLTNITIPDSVTTIGVGAFSNCGRLTSINVDAGNSAYSSDSRGVLFDKNKTTLIQYPAGNENVEYIIPNFITTIGDFAFSGHRCLTSITIPNSVTTIGASAFSHVDSLTSITIPDSVTIIGDHAFFYCESLTSIILSDSVTTISDKTFFHCESLTSITIPDSVTTIGDYAFYYCTSLTSVTISDNVRSIWHSAFEDCTNLTDIYYTGTEEQWSEILIGYDSGELSNTTIHYNSAGPDNTTNGDSNTSVENKEYYGMLESVGWSIPLNGEKYISQITVDGDSYAVKKGVLNNDFGSNLDKYVSFVIKNDEVIEVNLIEVHTGKLEKNSLVIILNGDESYYEILVDGKNYRVSDNVNAEKVDDKVGRNIVFVTENNRVVWLEAEMLLEPYISAYIDPNDLSNGYDGEIYPAGAINDYDFVYNGKEAKIKYSHHMRPIYINIYNGLNTKLFDGAPDYCADAMKLLYQYDVNVSEIRLTTSNKKVVTFNDDEILTVTGINNTIKSGKTYVVDTGKNLKVNPDYKMKEKNETYYVYCDIKGTVNGRTFTNQTTEEINLIDNGKYLIINNNSNNNTNNNDSNSSDNINYQINNLAQKAAEKLSAISGEIALQGIKANVPDLFTDAQLDAIGDMLLCEVAMAAAPEDTYKEALSEKIIDKIFSIDTNFLGVKSGEVSVTVAVDSKKYGNVKVKFICEFSGYLLSGSPFAYMGNIDYEIVGGKGESKINKKSGFAGALSGVDMESFCNAAYDVALSEIKSGYNKVWGDNANAAADIIFNKTVKDILKYTKKSVSGIYWDIITTPATSVKVECPVDVFVYDENDNLVASVENNRVTLTDPEVEMSVNGDTKHIKIYSKAYRIAYKAFSEGSLKVTVEECGGLDSVIRTTVIDNIPLKAGAKFTQDIDGTVLEDSDYSIVGQNEIYGHDSDTIIFHEHISNEIWNVGKVSTCTENGWSWSNCTICGDCLTADEELVGHTFNEGESKCSNCNFDKADECSCNCHASGIKKFFFNFILFFQKIFKKNAVCACGVAHY